MITDTDLGDPVEEREALGPGVDIRSASARSPEEVIAAAENADGLLVQWAPITEAVIGSLPRLRAIVRYGIGLDNIDLEAAQRSRVLVSNVPDYCIDEVAEHTVALILSLARRIPALSNAIKAGGWAPDLVSTPRRFSQQSVGLVGFGRIGRLVAQKCAAEGFQTLAWDPFLDTEAFGGISRCSTLEELAFHSDFLSLHVPATDETTHLVGAEVLAALGTHGYVVNTARGALIDEVALLEALDSGRIAGAGLDVVVTEPPTGTSLRLVQHDRVVATPHIAYLSTTSLTTLKRRAGEIMAELLGLPSV